MPTPTPSKPFPSYKWKWASLEPTEGLNNPLVFISALRVFCKNEGRAPSSQEVYDDLLSVQKSLKLSVEVDLARTKERNLVRNSGQYWKGLGVLAPKRGKIEVTHLGKKLCHGRITEAEFAATVIATLTLPNPLITDQAEINEWNKVGLSIKPLELLLEVIAHLQQTSVESGFLTKQELTKLVIPLAGEKTPVPGIAQAVLEFRQGVLDPKGWPNCIPDDNDHRMAREFLLFLSYHDYCELREVDREERFYLSRNIQPDEVAIVSSVNLVGDYRDADIELIRSSGLPDIVERRRITREILERSQQGNFRKGVFSAAKAKCLFTGVELSDALEAAHIIPVGKGGDDATGNGLCLRTDIHDLFDRGHIRLAPDGSVHFSEAAEREHCYGSQLPKKVNFPGYVNMGNISWRWEHL